MDSNSAYIKDLEKPLVLDKKVVKAKPYDGFKDNNTGFVALIISVLLGLWMSITIMFNKVGLNWFIFALLGVLGVMYLMHRAGNLNIKHAVFWLMVIMVYASVFFRQTYLLAPTFLLLPGIIVLMTIYAARDERKNIMPQFLYRHFAFFIHFWNIFMLKISGNNKHGKKSSFIKVLLGIGIAGLLLTLIIPLMFSADMMFEKTLGKVFEIDNLDELIGRIVVGTIITLASFAFMFTIIVKANSPKKQEHAQETETSDFNATIITVLTIIAAVFALFIAIQVKYLVGGMPPGLSYTKYAVSGYWEQAWLTAINLGVVLLALWLSRYAKGSTKHFINSLLTTMVGLNTYLVFSAAYKMRLYEQAYGFTPKRALVYLILLFELIMFILIIYKIFKRNFNFFKTAVYLGVAYFAIVSCINFQAFSVSQNIKRYEKTGEIDVEFLANEAADATKQVYHFYVTYRKDLTIQQKLSIARGLDYKIKHDNYIINDFQRTHVQAKWYEYNIARYNQYRYGSAIVRDAIELKEKIPDGEEDQYWYWYLYN